MDCVVIADFKCKEGMAAEMSNVLGRHGGDSRF